MKRIPKFDDKTLLCFFNFCSKHISKALERKVHPKGLLYWLIYPSYQKVQKGPELDILTLDKTDCTTIFTYLRKVGNSEQINE